MFRVKRDLVRQRGDQFHLGLIGVHESGFEVPRLGLQLVEQHLLTGHAVVRGGNHTFRLADGVLNDTVGLSAGFR